MVERATVGLIAGQAARSMEDGEGAIWIVVDPHAELDEVGPRPARRDLQDQAVVADGVVVSDHTALLDAEDVAMGGRTIALRQRMSKVETPDEWTEIAVESVDYDIDLPDSLFTLSNLRNPRE